MCQAGTGRSKSESLSLLLLTRSGSAIPVCVPLTAILTPTKGSNTGGGCAESGLKILLLDPMDLDRMLVGGQRFERWTFRV